MDWLDFLYSSKSIFCSRNVAFYFENGFAQQKTIFLNDFKMFALIESNNRICFCLHSTLISLESDNNCSCCHFQEKKSKLIFLSRFCKKKLYYETDIYSSMTLILEAGNNCNFYYQNSFESGLKSLKMKYFKSTLYVTSSQPMRNNILVHLKNRHSNRAILILSKKRTLTVGAGLHCDFTLRNVKHN